MLFLAYTSPQEVDLVVLRRLRATIDNQRDQIRAKDREIQQKSTDVENVSVQKNELHF